MELLLSFDTVYLHSINICFTSDMLFCDRCNCRKVEKAEVFAVSSTDGNLTASILFEFKLKYSKLQNETFQYKFFLFVIK